MSKNTFLFTQASLDALPLPAAGNRITYHDSKATGLQLRITSSGIKSFCVFKWVKSAGKLKRVTLGRYPDISLQQARREAFIINAAIVNGHFNQDVKPEMTFAELFELYLERWSKPHKKTWKGDIHAFNLYCRKRFNIADYKLSELTKAELSQIHITLGKQTPVMANRMLALISSMLNWAIQQDLWTGKNPVTGIRKFSEKSRDRFIQSDELPLFFEALAGEPNQLVQDYFLMLLLTGVRRSNLLAMRWDEISFERKEWRIPETKNGTPQVISLDDDHHIMLSLLENRRHKSGMSPFVFAGIGEEGHITPPRKAWLRLLARAEVYQIIDLIGKHKEFSSTVIQQMKLDANTKLQESLERYRSHLKALGLNVGAIGLPDLRIHDLRRTLGSWMAGTGASTIIIGRQLNHKSEAATRIYARLQLNPVKEARNKALNAMWKAIN